MAPPVLVWMRRCLRVDDNPLLETAARSGAPVLPVYIHAPEEAGHWPPGPASRWWLRESLGALSRGLARHHAPLVLRAGKAAETLRALARETGAKAVYYDRRPEPALVERDAAAAKALAREGVALHGVNASLLVTPEQLLTKQGRPYQVFTPFWQAAVQAFPVAAPGGAPRLRRPEGVPGSLEPDALFDGAAPEDGAWSEYWTPGEAGAESTLDAFLEEALSGYPERRDFPGVRGTSRLSPHLHFGEVSPWRVLHAVHEFAGTRTRGGLQRGAEAWIRQLYWRGFGHYLLHHFPFTPEAPLRRNFEAFPWARDRGALERWKRGETGYPIVDAGMRELRATGWMHNRVRMVVASFLVKDLLLPWQQGAAWFWERLVDADLANNTLGWQWAGGCGADAAPYFRIFNPVLQGEKFDGNGAYVRRWAPELAGLPDKRVHKPWTASSGDLEAAGLKLGVDYPEPIVDHGEARERALAAFAEVKGSG